MSIEILDISDLGDENRDILPVRVSSFDSLITEGGIERGNTILLTGGCGTGKSTFSLQSAYYSCQAGERIVYITLEESPKKLIYHIKKHFNWDISNLKDNFLIARVNPFKLVLQLEIEMSESRGEIISEMTTILDDIIGEFSPDKIYIDTISALTTAFERRKIDYRQYLLHLFDRLEQYNSVNFVLGETEQLPTSYSRTGILEFLVDGVVVFYNIRTGVVRQRALEILKLRCSEHIRKIVPFSIDSAGINLEIGSELIL